MKITAKLAEVVVHRLIKTFCRIENGALVKVPAGGPLIIILNHINFLEVPLMHLELLPREITGLVKRETWNNFILGFLGNLWGAIPLDRDRTDFTALRQCLDLLKSGGILCVAPEGTRSGDGKLLKGQAGVVTLALHSKAPILPVVHYGGEKVWDNLRRIRKTRFRFCVGKPFRLKKPGKRVPNRVRDEILTEIMYQMAVHLPESYRGYYADTQKATTKYLDFIE